MKNERYLAAAVARLRADRHLPEEVLALSDDDIVAITQSVTNAATEIARQSSVDVELTLGDDELLDAFLTAHKRGVTLDELVEEAVQHAVYEAQAQTLYESEGGTAWASLSDEEKHPYYVRSSV